MRTQLHILKKKKLSSLGSITSNNREFTISRGIFIHGHKILGVDQYFLHCAEISCLPPWMRKQSFSGLDFSYSLTGMKKYRFTECQSLKRLSNLLF